MNLEDYDFDRLLALGYTEKATGELKKACWAGYTAIGTKKKGGRTVPNCVPIKKSEHSESDDFRQMQMGGDLLVDVECNANLPVSTPAELREAQLRKRVTAAQNKAQRQEAREQAKRAREAKRASREAKRMQQGFAEDMKRMPIVRGPSAGSSSFAEGIGKMMDEQHVGSDFDDFLRNERLLDDAEKSLRED